MHYNRCKTSPAKKATSRVSSLVGWNSSALTRERLQEEVNYSRSTLGSIVSNLLARSYFVDRRLMLRTKPDRIFATKIRANISEPRTVVTVIDVLIVELSARFDGGLPMGGYIVCNS